MNPDPIRESREYPCHHAASLASKSDDTATDQSSFSAAVADLIPTPFVITRQLEEEMLMIDPIAENLPNTPAPGPMPPDGELILEPETVRTPTEKRIPCQ